MAGVSPLEVQEHSGFGGSFLGKVCWFPSLVFKKIVCFLDLDKKTFGLEFLLLRIVLLLVFSGGFFVNIGMRYLLSVGVETAVLSYLVLYSGRDCQGPAKWSVGLLSPECYST